MVEALECRRHLNASEGGLIASGGAREGNNGPAVVAAARRSASLAAVGSGLTIADRRELAGRFGGELSASLTKTLKHSGPEAFDATLLKYMVRRPGPVFFYNPKRINHVVEFIEQRIPLKIPVVVGKGDSLLAHRFQEQINSEVFGVQLEAEIDWDETPATTTNPNFLHAMNRHNFWKDLATAYRVSGEGKYVTELAAEVRSWAEQTPALKDPDSWATSGPGWWLLNAADRANNWTYAYFMVLGAPEWTAETNTAFLANIWEHGDFLSNVTPSSIRKNRTAVHAAGLLRLGIMFPEFSDAATWKNKGFDLTFRSMAAQFYPDGGHVEETPIYQITALNAFLENYQLAQLNGLTNWTKARRRMFLNGVEALYQMLTPKGVIPGISDTYRSANPKPFLTRAGFFLGQERYVLDGAQLEDAFLVGPDVLRSFFNPNPYQLSGRGLDYAMPDSGYYMMRDGLSSDGTSSGQVLFDAGPKGGAHGHFDLLSFELEYSYATDGVVDPGPLRYDDSAEREYFISTPAHNTISIDGKNHEAVEGLNNPKIVVDKFEHGEEFGLISAHHHAYEYLAGRPTVGRSILMTRAENDYSTVIVVDWGRSDPGKQHTFTTNFNFPTPNLQEISLGVYDSKLTGFVNVRVQSLAMPGQSGALLDSFVSNRPPPNEKTAAKRYAVSQTGTSALFVTAFTQYVPVTEDAPTVTFESRPRAGEPVQLRITRADGTYRSVAIEAPALTAL